MITDWEPKDFQMQKTSVWSFPDRGSWATHDGKWRGNWSPYIPRNIILRYSQIGDLVLDQFAGGGTTLVEAKLLNRNAIGIDVNPNAIARCQTKTDFIHAGCFSHVDVTQGDARNLKGLLDDESVDLICTHPPYADIIRYSENQSIQSDLSNFEPGEFLRQMIPVAQESYRVLKRGKYCAVLMGDARKKGNIIPISFRTMELFQNAGFVLKEIVIKEQHNCQSTDKWAGKQLDFLLIAHEYLFIFKKV